jgi:hypothetical protein
MTYPRTACSNCIELARLGDDEKLTLTNNYVISHPGGVEIVTDLAGQDATADYDDVGHTQEAHEILEKFLIGHLKAGAPVAGGSTPAPAAVKKEEAPKPAATSAPAPVQVKPAPQTVKPKAPVPQEDDSSMMIMAGVAIAAAAAGFLFYKRSLKA